MSIPRPAAVPLACAILWLACSPPSAAETPIAYAPEPYVRLTHPEWTRDAVIYQVNTRQFTPEGTFAAAARQLPRLQELGVDILWLMPIHPIGEKNRKGSLGSPYSVKDYYGVNPEFGSLDDFRALVDQAHALGLHVILDWVGNHTAWDNPLVDQHPEWYLRDWKGDFIPTPWYDWSDIIDLDFDQPGLRRYMIDAMAWWVRETGVDGYRADTAGYVPLDFWEQARAELERIRPVFMLGEGEYRDLHQRSFDATYAWSWYEAMHKVAQGQADVGALVGYYSTNESAWPAEAMRMPHVTNHDKNAWEGTMFEAFGDALDAAIVLSVVGEGIPMMYNGQEAGNEKRLEFFEKEPIRWRPHPIGDLYQKLIDLKTQYSPLWNGQWGARMVPVTNTQPGQVLSFVRADDAHGVLGLFNFSAQGVQFKLQDGPFAGRWKDAFGADSFELSAGSELTLPAWGWRVLVR
jgi:glycosidase